MTERRCSECIFYHRCFIDGGCDDYYPLADDGYVPQEDIANDRAQYYRHWIEYITEG